MFSANSTAILALTAITNSVNAAPLSGHSDIVAICDRMSTWKTQPSANDNIAAPTNLLGQSQNASALHELALPPLKEEIESFRQLTTGWDGPHSTSPHSQAVNDALLFVGQLSPEMLLPDASVANDGEVGVYWRTANAHIEVSFRGGGKLTYYSRVDGDIKTGTAPSARSSGIPVELRSLVSQLS